MPFTKRYGPILGRFTDFSHGEYGSTGGRRATPGQFTGNNVVVYLNGSIGPRPPAANITPNTAGGDGGPVGLRVLGRVRHGFSLGYAVDTNGNAWWFGYPGNNPWRLFAPAFAQNVSQADWVDDGSVTYVVSSGDQCYELNHATHTTAVLAGSPSGNCICIFGEHLVVGGVDGTENQIRFSDPNDYQSWPALHFLNVGQPHDEIVSLQVQRNILIVTLDTGDIWTISGTLGVNEVVRRFSSTAPRTAHLNASAVALTKRGLLWRRGRNSAPESFDGAQLRALPFLDNWLNVAAGAVSEAICCGLDDDDISIMGQKYSMLLLHHGTWTKHNLAPHVGSSTVFAVYDGDDTLWYCVNLGTDPVTPRIYGLNMGLERPAISALGDLTEDYESGHAPVCSFTLPEIRDSAGRGLNPREVNIRFTKFLTGGVDTNHWEAFVNVHDVYESEQPPPLTSFVFDEPNSEATVNGTRQEILLPFDPGGDVGACSVTLTNLRGCQIDEIVVYGTIVPERSFT